MMLCLIGHTPTTVSFLVNDISRMSSLTQQVNDLCHNPHRTRHFYICRVRVTSTLWSTCSTTLFRTKALHFYSDIGVAPTISLCRVRSWFLYDLYVILSPAQQHILQSWWHVVYCTPVQTWIRLQVSQTWTIMLTFYVESRLLLHCCVQCYQINNMFLTFYKIK